MLYILIGFVVFILFSTVFTLLNKEEIRDTYDGFHLFIFYMVCSAVLAALWPVSLFPAVVVFALYYFIIKPEK